MASLTIRRLEDSTKERLRIRASHHGRSMEAEAREILTLALNEKPAPEQNLAELLRKGVPVGLGSDVVPPDPFALIRSVVSIHAKRRESKRISFGEAFHMATLGGAAVFGLEEQIGSLEEGKQADVVLVKNPAAIDLDLFRDGDEQDDSRRQKRIDAVARLFTWNVLGKEHVDTVIVGGKTVLRHGAIPSGKPDQETVAAGRAAALAILKRSRGGPENG